MIALGAAILTAVQLFKVFTVTGIQVALMMLITVAVVCRRRIDGLEKMSYQVALTIHRVALILAAVAMAVMVYLLAG